MYVDTRERDFTKKSQKRKNFKIIQNGEKFSLKCKGGKTVKSYYYSKKYYFQFRKNECKSCQFYSECFKNISEKNLQKTVAFTEFELTNKKKINEYLEKMNHEDGKRIYARRIGKEHVFANMKTQRNYLQTFYRGKDKLQMDTHWAALAQNMQKYIVSMRK